MSRFAGSSATPKESVDYDVADLRWLWVETIRQDKDIIELNARGISTRGY